MIGMKRDEAILQSLNGDFRRIAEIAGVAAALQISEEFGGLYISIPKLDFLDRFRRNAEIRDEYDKADDKTGVVKRLARKHDLTTKQIYNILNEQPGEGEEIVPPLFSAET
jgi:Mor family transcriptional regulator